MQTITTIGLDIANSVFQTSKRRATWSSAAAQAALRASVFPEAIAVPSRYRGNLRQRSFCSFLGEIAHTIKRYSAL
jgi:hypothetical protein